MRWRLFALLLFSQSSQAVFFSSKDLYQWLENDVNDVEIYQGGMAKGYLMGILDMLAASRQPEICHPTAGISALELKIVVLTYMQNHPDQLKLSPEKLVAKALLAKWPCH